MVVLLSICLYLLLRLIIMSRDESAILSTIHADLKEIKNTIFLIPFKRGIVLIIYNNSKDRKVTNSGHHFIAFITFFIGLSPLFYHISFYGAKGLYFPDKMLFTIYFTLKEFRSVQFKNLQFMVGLKLWDVFFGRLPYQIQNLFRDTFRVM